MTTPNSIALNFLPLTTQDFTYKIFRKPLEGGEPNVPGISFLPEDCSGEDKTAPRLRYAVSFEPVDGYQQVSVGAWVDPSLTVRALHKAMSQLAAAALGDAVEPPENDFTRFVGIRLAKHPGANELMQLRAHALKRIGHFGFLCKFHLKTYDETALTPQRRLEISLTHKGGRLNEDYYADQYEKVENFLSRFHDKLSTLTLHDGTKLELAPKLAAVPSFTLNRRTYVFANQREHRAQFFGLRDYGPLQRVQGSPKLAFVYAEADHLRSQDLFRALRGDTFQTFPGMDKMFGLQLNKDNVIGLKVKDFDYPTLRKATSDLRAHMNGHQIVPVALVPFSKHQAEDQSPQYYAAKHAFLSEGFSSQFVDRRRLDDANALKWSISNIALGIFAKLGGVPWQVRPSTQRCLVIGIGQAHRRIEERIDRFIAYSVLTDSSGLYESIRMLGESASMDDYLKALKKNLRDVLSEHAGEYQSFVLHMTWSMKRYEIDAIREVLEDLNKDSSVKAEFVAIKFNDKNDFLGFAVEKNSRIPLEGTVTKLSKSDFLLWFSGLGLDDNKAPKKPERPVHLSIMYPKAAMDEAVTRRLLQDAINIAGANWRGFNGKSMPISVYYAKLIAEYYSRFREQNLPDINFDKMQPWFL